MKERSLQEKVEGLCDVAARLPGDWTIVYKRGDVTCLRRPGSPYEVAFEVNGYDVWDIVSGNPVRFDISADEAVKVLR